MRLFLSFSNTVISAKFKLHFENNFPGFFLLFLRFRIFDVVSSFPFLYLLSHGICPGFWLMAPGSSYGGGQLYWEIGSLFLYNQQSIIIVCMNTAATGPKKALWSRLIHDPISFLAVPEIEVVDDRDKKTAEKYYKGGSTIELKCIVRQIVGEPPEYILWHHEDRMLNYDTERGGIRYL